MKKKLIPEYDILRIIVTFLVIFGHCGYYAIVTSYGGRDYAAPISEANLSSIYRIIVYVISQIYFFHMILYMMLSGALYRHSRSGGGTLLGGS